MEQNVKNESTVLVYEWTDLPIRPTDKLDGYCQLRGHIPETQG